MSKFNNNAPFKYDIVGSFLRPLELKNARKQYESGKISIENLRKVEDDSIKDLVEKEKRIGLRAVTDGEFRRSWWHLDFMWGLNGIEKIAVEEGYSFHTETTRPESAAVCGKIDGKNHPFVEHFKFLKSVAGDDVICRQTIPSPAQVLAELQRETKGNRTLEFYPDIEELIKDLSNAYKTVITDLYEAGCRNLQLDDCTWGAFCDDNFWEKNFKKEINTNDINKGKGVSDKESIINLFIKINNLAIENHPEDLVITTHVCRGNYHSTWSSTGGYGPIAPYLFATENVDAYYLEYDTERAGGFEPLQYVSGDKQVVLGLITSKSPQLEKKNDIIARIQEATQYISLERLCLSPQCGFASTEEGNILTEEEQWEKIKLVKEIAEEVWK